MEASSQVLVGKISADDTDCVEGKQNIRYNVANSACKTCLLGYGCVFTVLFPRMEFTLHSI